MKIRSIVLGAVLAAPLAAIAAAPVLMVHGGHFGQPFKKTATELASGSTSEWFTVHNLSSEHNRIFTIVGNVSAQPWYNHLNPSTDTDGMSWFTPGPVGSNPTASEYVVFAFNLDGSSAIPAGYSTPYVACYTQLPGCSAVYNGSTALELDLPAE
jgi:hypothetical protein